MFFTVSFFFFAEPPPPMFHYLCHYLGTLRVDYRGSDLFDSPPYYGEAAAVRVLGGRWKGKTLTCMKCWMNFREIQSDFLVFPHCSQTRLPYLRSIFLASSSIFGGRRLCKYDVAAYRGEGGQLLLLVTTERSQVEGKREWWWWRGEKGFASDGYDVDCSRVSTKVSESGAKLSYSGLWRIPPSTNP